MFADWLHIKIETIIEPGKEDVVTFTYSHTPEEFVAELQQRGEHILVTNRSCAECFYTPDRSVDKHQILTMTEEALKMHRIPECICASFARYLQQPVPDFVLCYGFFYQYWSHNKYLLAAKNAGLITFFEVSSLPSPRTLGVSFSVAHFK